jgi:hypothetical protein
MVLARLFLESLCEGALLSFQVKTSIEGHDQSASLKVPKIFVKFYAALTFLLLFVSRQKEGELFLLD